MKLRLQLVVESETGDVVTTQDVAQLQRLSFRPEEVGLTLAEAKQLLGSVQRVMVQREGHSINHKQVWRVYKAAGFGPSAYWATLVMPNPRFEFFS
jgi:alkylated DNA nucleotide flippase Atl1